MEILLLGITLELLVFVVVRLGGVLESPLPLSFETNGKILVIL